MSVAHSSDPEDLPPATPDGRDLDDLAGEIDFAAADQERYRLDAYIDYQTRPDGRPAVILTEDLLLAQDLNKVLAFIEHRLIAPYTPLPMFTLETRLNGQLDLRRTPDTHGFLWTLWTVMNRLLHRFPLMEGVQFPPRRPPYLALFQHLAQRYGETYPVIGPYPLVMAPLQHPHPALYHPRPYPRDPVAWITALNRWVDDYRHDVCQSAFKEALRAYQRPALENYRSLADYINGLFERHARLLVLRVDLSYTEAQYRRDGRDYAEVRTHREALLRYLRRDPLFGPVLVGYAWKLEYGIDKRGFHYHLLVFLDGAKVREDICLARTLGEHWVQVITEGAGQYFNCNAQKLRYQHVCTGMIQHDDAKGIQGLEYAAKYLTKPDPFLSALLPPHARSFGKGDLPPPHDPRQGGRPRTTPTCRLSRDPRLPRADAP